MISYLKFNCQALYLNMIINMNSDNNDEILLVSYCIYCTAAQIICQVFAMYSHNYKSFLTFKKYFALKENTGNW